MHIDGYAYDPAGKGSFMTSVPSNLLSKPQTMSAKMKYIYHFGGIEIVLVSTHTQTHTLNGYACFMRINKLSVCVCEYT